MKQKQVKYAFEKYYHALLMFANKLLRDHELSKDAVQSVFLRLLEKKDLFEVKNIKSYLFTSVRNHCLDYLRKTHITKTGSYNEELENSYDFQDTIEIAEFEAQLFEFIESLPPATKRIFKMSRFKFLSNEEIAKELNLSKRTVELQISKALKALREMINNSGLKESTGKRMILLFF